MERGVWFRVRCSLRQITNVGAQTSCPYDIARFQIYRPDCVTNLALIVAAIHESHGFLPEIAMDC